MDEKRSCYDRHRRALEEPLCQARTVKPFSKVLLPLAEALGGALPQHVVTDKRGPAEKASLSGPLDHHHLALGSHLVDMLQGQQQAWKDLGGVLCLDGALRHPVQILFWVNK